MKLSIRLAPFQAWLLPGGGHEQSEFVVKIARLEMLLRQTGIKFDATSPTGRKLSLPHLINVPKSRLQFLQTRFGPNRVVADMEGIV